MTAAAHVPSDVETYLARVRAALEDVPVDERTELLAEIEASVYATAAETEGSVAARLGPPEDFAAELRWAAGLHGPAPAATASTRDALARVFELNAVRHGRRLGHELAPIWWVARGYLAVAAVALLFDQSWSAGYHGIPHVGTAAAGLALILLAIVASVALGLASRRTHSLSRALVVLNLALLAAAIPVGAQLAQRPPRQFEVVTVPAVVPGLSYNGTPVDNIYPYSRQGRLLHDVFLYTGAGAPLDVATASPDPNRRVARTVSGRRVFNVFPIRYFEPGTKVVRNPNAAPKVHPPRLATRPLRRR